MVGSQYKTIEHLLNVSCYGYRFFPEADQHSKEGVIQVWAREQNIVEGYTTMLCTGVKDHPDLVRFLRVLNSKDRQVPAFLSNF